MSHIEEAARKLASTYIEMLNSHNPKLVDKLVAENYVNHNAFVAEANRQFWTGFFAALPDLTVTMEGFTSRVIG